MSHYYQEAKTAFVIDEVARIREEIAVLDGKIDGFELSPAFNATDVRYIRAVTDKKILLENLCQLRLSLAQFQVHMVPPASARYSGVCATLPAEPLLAVAASGSAPAQALSMIEADVNKRSRATMEDENVSPNGEGAAVASIESGDASAADGHQDALNRPVVLDDDVASPKKRKLPDVQTDQYSTRKNDVCTIMRNLTEKKVYLVATDGSDVTVPIYQILKARVKSGEEISKLLRGSVEKFVISIDKKKGEVTEKQIFVPEFRDV